MGFLEGAPALGFDPGQGSAGRPRFFGQQRRRFFAKRRIVDDQPGHTCGNDKRYRECLRDVVHYLHFSPSKWRSPVRE